VFWGSNELAANIKFGDIPAWIAALGTTGTLITGMYIILTNRTNQYRSQFDNLIVYARSAPEPDSEGRTVRLKIINRSSGNFHDIEIYGLTDADFSDGSNRPMAFYCHRAEIIQYQECVTGPIFTQVRAMNAGPSIVLTWRATDQVGRTWLKERRKPARLITWRNRCFVQRKLDQLKAKIVETDDFAEPPRSADTRTDL